MRALVSDPIAIAGPGAPLRRLAATLCLGATLALAPPAHADDDDEPGGPRTAMPAPPPAAPVAPAVPDATWQQLIGHDVVVALRDGRTLRGVALRVSREVAILALDPRGDLVAIARADAVFVRPALVLPARPDAQGPDDPDAPPRPAARRATRPDDGRLDGFGVHLGVGPPVPVLDYAYGRFYAFLSGSPGTAALSGGHAGGISLGLGLLAPVARGSRWQITPFANLSYLLWGDDGYLGVGVGLGFQYTTPGGFVFGLKVPVFGLTLTSRTSSFYLDSSTGYYFLGALINWPIVSVGYRWL